MFTKASMQVSVSNSAFAKNSPAAFIRFPATACQFTSCRNASEQSVTEVARCAIVMMVTESSPKAILNMCDNTPCTKRPHTTQSTHGPSFVHLDTSGLLGSFRNKQCFNARATLLTLTGTLCFGTLCSNPSTRRCDTNVHRRPTNHH